MKNTLVVISKDKLIATDTVAPIIRKYKEVVNGIVYFYVPHRRTFEYIKENFILYNAISEVSNIRVIAYGKKLKRRILYIKFFFLWLFLALRGAKFIHFGFLNNWPFSLIAKINPNNIYYMQNDTYYHTNSESRAKAHGLGNVNEILYGKWENSIDICGNNIISNSYDNFFLKNPKNKCKNIFIVSGTRLNDSWLNFIYKNEYKYDELYSGVDFSNGIIVYALGTFEPHDSMRNIDSAKELFKETMGMLVELDLDIPIFIKPHVYTQMEYVEKVLSNINSDNVYISYLHPTLLAIRARVWICFGYSTTCADAYCMGVKTIEYTDYNDSFLNVCLGRSVGHQYIDYFIQRNTEEFCNVLLNLLDGDYSPNKKRCKFIDDSDIVKHLS